MTKSANEQKAVEQQNKPTKTFQNFDNFNRKPFADQLTKVISTFYSFYDEAFVLSLDAKFGSGKTTFLEMWQEDLVAQGYTVISINAWETDFDEEPLVPIISALIEKISSKENSKKMQTALRGALGAVALASNGILDNATGINVHEIMKAVEEDLTENNKKIQEIGLSLYKEYSFKKSAYEKLKEELSNYVESISKKPLIVFVDELDRVRPDYGVKFLEAIKHIFSVKGVSFVLTVDKQQLECSIKQLYGEIDFKSYYARFITREAQLSEVKKLDLKPFIKGLAEDFFDEKRANGIKFPFKQNQQEDVLQEIATVCKISGFSPREIKYFFRIFSQLMAITSDKTVKFPKIQAAIFLISIFMKNPDLYHKIGNGQASPNDVAAYINELNYSLFQHTDVRRMVMLLAMSFLMSSDKPQDQRRIAEICINLDDPNASGKEGYDQKKQEMIGMLARAFLNDFGQISRQSYFQIYYNLLEEWRAFLD